MSRVSLSRRLAAVLDAAESIDPLATRIHRLPDALRMRYDVWRAQCEAQCSYGNGAAYEAMLAGDIVLHDPPRAVAQAVGIERPPVLPDTMSLAELSDLYRVMCEG